jgi:hypothetical protein
MKIARIRAGIVPRGKNGIAAGAGISLVTAGIENV